MTGLAAVLAAATLLFAHSNAGPVPTNVTVAPAADACASVQCAPRAGCKALHRPDACCPLYQCECELDGRVYGNGDKLVDPGDPCRVCYCQGGEVVCRRIACFRRDDCRPRAVPGRCCPEYDNCPITGGSAVIAAVQDASSAAPPPPPPPRETPKQEITIKEITPVSEIPSFSESKPKDTASRAPIIVREATPPQPEPSSPLPTLSTGMSSEETSKPTADDELLDHNPAFPPLPDDLTHREEDMLPDPELEPATPVSPAPSTPPTTSSSTPAPISTSTTPVPVSTSTSGTPAPVSSTESTSPDPTPVSTTAHTGLKASPMLNLRSAIPTEILNLPSSVPEDINGEMDDVAEVTTLLTKTTTISDEISKEVKTSHTEVTSNAPVTVAPGTETTTINTDHVSTSQTGTSRGGSEYLNIDGASSNLTSTNKVSTKQISTNRPETELVNTNRLDNNGVTTNKIVTDQPITNRIHTERATEKVRTAEPKNEKVNTDKPNNDKVGIVVSKTNSVINIPSNTDQISTVKFNTDPLLTVQPITVRAELPTINQVSTNQPTTTVKISTDQTISDRSNSELPKTDQVITERGTLRPDIELPKTDLIDTERVNTDHDAITNPPRKVQVATDRPSTERVSTNLVSTEQSNSHGIGTDQPLTNRPSINQVKSDGLNTERSTTQPSTNRLSTERPTTDRTTDNKLRLDIEAPLFEHDVTVAKTEFSSIPIETSDRKPQDTAENVNTEDVRHASVNIVSDGASEMVVTEMTTVFKEASSNGDGAMFDESTTHVVTSGSPVSVSAAEGAGAGVLGELIDLVGDVAAIGGREEPAPVPAGYKSRHQPSANSIDEPPARRRSPELEEAGGAPLSEPAPPSRAEPTTRLPAIDADGARPPAPSPPPAPQDIEIITSSYVPTISRRPTKLVQSEPAAAE